ncbi:DUF6148 family protein [Duganella sp. CT11-25]|uniref:DUF6148 family protein n=1 Tax=unclassified Duganella TaxID=2636909 RepID=UPI0039AE9695
MAGITLQLAQAQLESYLAAETAALAGQSYEIAGRKLTRADLATIQTGITLWNRRVGELASRATGRGRSRTLVPGG